jgi:hypothetical protein
MPAPGKRWWHIMWSTYRAWLPGDERGFHSKDHRVHSSGDYKKPPPTEEHEGLRSYHRGRGEESVRIPAKLRIVVAETIASAIEQHGHRILTVSVGADHVHAVAELPVNLAEYRQIIGTAKLQSSRAITQQLPGKIWARGEFHRMKRDKRALVSAYLYVRDKQGPAAAVWAFDGYRYDFITPPAPRRSAAAGSNATKPKNPAAARRRGAQS